ncbi:MAG: ester cyclase, partial [Actinobacteria bacterium]|nr:ester cyclase [Actinomycetota bacterium]
KAMEAGDQEAVFAFFAPEFSSHVTGRVNPDAVGSDIRGSELQWWTAVRTAFPDFTFSVNLLIESDDLIVSNWTVKGTHTGGPSTTCRRRASPSRSTARPSCACATARSSSTGAAPTARTGEA